MSTTESPNAGYVPLETQDDEGFKIIRRYNYNSCVIGYCQNTISYNEEKKILRLKRGMKEGFCAFLFCCYTCGSREGIIEIQNVSPENLENHVKKLEELQYSHC